MLCLHCTKKLLEKLPLLDNDRLKTKMISLNWTGFSPDVLMSTLLKAGAADRDMKAAEKLLAPLLCDNDTDRSVQGTMNRMAQDIGHMLDYQQFSRCWRYLSIRQESGWVGRC